MKKLILLGILLVSVLIGTIACASPEWSVSESKPAPVPAPAPAPMPPIKADGIAMEAPPPSIAIPSAPPVQGGRDYDEAFDSERMIVRTGDMSLVVEDVASTMEQIVGLAGIYEGYVVSSNSWQERERMMGNISIRVNADYFDDVIRSLRGLAVEVRQESTSGHDVTEEYVDLTARLQNLEASEAQLLKLMERAGTVEEILEVQRELVKTTGEIEQTKGRMQYLEESSDMSYIQVNLEQSKLTVEFKASTRSVKEGDGLQFISAISGGFYPYSYEWDFGDGDTSTNEVPSHAYKSDGSYTVTLKVTDDRGNTDTYERIDYITVMPGWSAGNIVSGAWDGLVGFGRALANFFIWVGIFSPLWIAIGLIVYFAWWRRRKKKV